MRDSGGAVTLGRVLTLIVKTEPGDDTEAAIAAANEASREHRAASSSPGRRPPQGPRLDAGSASAVTPGVRGSGAASVGELGAHADAVVTRSSSRHPRGHLVAGTAEEPFARPARRPWRATHPGRHQPLRRTGRPRAAVCFYAPGDTDIAWAQITPWRALLAAAFDRVPALKPVRVRVAGPGPSVGLDLLAGWLAEVPARAHRAPRR